MVVLTREGKRVRERLRSALYDPPAELVALGTSRLEALRGALAALPGGEGIMGERPIQEPSPEMANSSSARA
jgi:hypothetical protein